MSHGTDTRTLVLVGRTRNGKSATGNSILGGRNFRSGASSSGATNKAEMKSTMHGNRVINVIDTPGLFAATTDADTLGKEIVKCVELAKDGIHALLLVFSVKNRFSTEEESVLGSLKTLFGSKITDYMIVVFTGGDELDDEEETIEEYLGRECPPPLEKILEACKRRYVLFDNKTKDKGKKAEQLQALIDHVDKVVEANGGRPFVNAMILEKQLRFRQEEIDSLRAHSEAEVARLKKEIQEMYEVQLKQKAETMELKVSEVQARSELAQEQAARQMLDNEKQKYKEDAERLKEENKNLKQKNDNVCGGCEIL